MGKILATFLALTICVALHAQTPASSASADPQLLTVEGSVQVLPRNGADWLMARTNQTLHFGDYLRTGQRSRATLRLSPLTVLRINELTTLQLQPPAAPGKTGTLNLQKGETYFLGRDRPAEMDFQTPLVAGAIRGTEFNLNVAPDGRTVVSLVDGRVGLSNPLGQVEMTSGEQGTVEAGKAPVKSPMLEANNIIQWCLYYPGILDPNELGLSSQEQEDLAASLAAYRAGDLLQAVALYPADRTPGSPAEKVYRAATLLSVGQVEQAQSLLAGLNSNGDRPAELATALNEVIAVVKRQPAVRPTHPHLATEWLAESYYFQSHFNLPEALQAAKNAVAAAPHFGFAWARLAELQLSFGRLPQALAALDQSLQLSPRNAQALALRGFIELAQARDRVARVSFDQAIALDGALGNAWLGRGLCEIWRGRIGAGRDDIQVAAVVEPQRALFRSYLGKAFSADGDRARALRELALAQQLDPNDPTAWLYRALVEQKGNQINQAVRDVEESKKLNDNQSLFRSRFLLDQDLAVRNANLARIYQDTGPYTWNKDVQVSDWSVQTASRAVDDDYANFSAHEFLANSYDALRDPNQINLRYETAWQDELFMSDLLSPVASGNLSDFSSQRQYARLFDANHIGASSSTEYLSRGDWLQRGSAYGNYDDFGYAMDVEYRSQNGWRANNDAQQLTASPKFKFQLTPQDSLFLEAVYYVSTYGDLAQYYNQYGNVPGQPAPATEYHGNEWQAPDVYVGYDHQWSPNSHTLFLGGYLDDKLGFGDPQAVGIIAQEGGVAGLTTNAFPTTYDRHYYALSAELQHIFQTDRQTLVVGTRYQYGWMNTSANEQFATPFGPKTFSQDYDNLLQRYNVYGYETVKVFDPLQLTAGVAYDYLRYPANVENAPVSSGQSSRSQVSPKAGFIWTITPETFFRFAYTRSLGGLSYDNSVRLEPTTVAGFNQAFRSIIPESVAGIVPGSRFTTYGVGLDRSFKSNTYFTIQGQILDSDGNRSVGVFNNPNIVPSPPTSVTTIPQTLGYSEQSLSVALTQLLGNNWSIGENYQLGRAELSQDFSGITSAQKLSGRLQQSVLFLNYYNQNGLFGQFQAAWYNQVNNGYSPGLPGSDFWQFNAWVGYRFWHRTAEIRLGVLNIANQDYLLNPLNLYYDLPRSRTLAASFQFYF